MLERITLKNFRQFEDKSLTFNTGTTALRGRNEGGKSTVIEGFLYAVGGAKRCRNNDFVRWGAKPGECRVEALMKLQGQPVRVTRSPRGAEVYVGADTKPTVTGQKEVTSWFASQFGATLDVVMKMAFATQEDLRGLLDDKNGKVMEFIEEMSGLDIVDFIIQQIGLTGETGSTAALEDATLQAKQQLEAEQKISYDDAIVAVESRLTPLVETQRVVEQQIDSLKAAVKESRAQLTTIQTWKLELASAERTQRARVADVSEARITLESVTRHLDKLVAATKGLPQEREQLVARQESARLFAQRRRAWDQLQQYAKPEVEWDAGEPALREAIAGFQAELKGIDTQISEKGNDVRVIERDITKAEALRITQTACGLCGKDLSDVPEVQQKNADVDERVAALTMDLSAVQSIIADLQNRRALVLEDLQAHRDVLDAPRFTAIAARHAGLFELDEQYVPPRVKWIGPDVSGDAPTDPAARIDEIDRALTRAQRQKQEVDAAQLTVSGAENHLARANEDLAALQARQPEGDENALVATIEQLEVKMDAARADMMTRAQSIGEQQGQLKSLQEGAGRHAALIERLQQQVSSGEAVLARYVFNNSLIEDLRRARPVVANALWNQILKAVSSYLTKMRGEPSIVTRDGSVFMVNGKPFSSYSGSALDLLALGLRSALTKVFVPGINMQVLDEPFAACDETRTNQCLAFLAGAGFAQTIVITHEDATETVFENIIEVTE